MKWLDTARTGAREEVHVEVVDDLPTLRPAVQPQAVPALGEALGLAETLRREDAAAHDFRVSGRERHDRRDVTLRDDEQVHGRLRVDVLEGEHRIVLVLDIRRVLARDDAAEDAIGHRLPPGNGLAIIAERRNRIAKE